MQRRCAIDWSSRWSQCLPPPPYMGLTAPEGQQTRLCSGSACGRCAATPGAPHDTQLYHDWRPLARSCAVRAMRAGRGKGSACGTEGTEAPGSRRARPEGLSHTPTRTSQRTLWPIVPLPPCAVFVARSERCGHVGAGVLSVIRRGRRLPEVDGRDQSVSSPPLSPPFLKWKFRDSEFFR